MSFISPEDYQELIEDIVRDGRLYASENHQEILKVSTCLSRQEGSHELPTTQLLLLDTEPRETKISSLLSCDLTLLNVKFLSLVFFYI